MSLTQLQSAENHPGKPFVGPMADPSPTSLWGLLTSPPQVAEWLEGTPGWCRNEEEGATLMLGSQG